MEKALYLTRVRHFCEVEGDMVTKDINLNINPVSNTQRSVILAAYSLLNLDCGYVFVYNPESDKARADGWVQMHDYDNRVF